MKTFSLWVKIFKCFPHVFPSPPVAGFESQSPCDHRGYVLVTNFKVECVVTFNTKTSKDHRYHHMLIYVFSMSKITTTMICAKKYK